MITVEHTKVVVVQSHFMHTSAHLFKQAKARFFYCTHDQYGVITLVKWTGPWVSNWVLGHSSDHQVWVHPKHTSKILYLYTVHDVLN